jgi:pyruvate/2-oxoglutarate dehydrogenase complex dihydrolipoamide dehydrogenase (E3) component
MDFSKDGSRGSAEAALAVIAVGWVANTSGMDLSAAGVELNERGFVQVNEYLQTTTAQIFAAGDVIGGQMLVPQALQGGFIAATNAVRGPSEPYWNEVSPIGSFTDPEYAQVGLSEAKARESHDVLTTIARFDSVARTIIDGRKAGFCKVITDRNTYQILGCHIVGERAVDIAQVVAIAISAGMKVNDFLRIPLSFPTYTGGLVRAASAAAQGLHLPIGLGDENT